MSKQPKALDIVHEMKRREDRTDFRTDNAVAMQKGREGCSCGNCKMWRPPKIVGGKLGYCTCKELTRASYNICSNHQLT
jgi:hypothetical protein